MPILWLLIVITNAIMLHQIHLEHKRSPKHIDGPFFLLLLSITLWSGIQLLVQLIFSDQIVILLHELKFAFVFLFLECLNIFVNTYIGKPAPSKLSKYTLYGIDTLLLLGIFTNPIHSLFRSNLEVVRGHTTIIYTTNEILYYIMIAYVYFRILQSLIALVKHILTLPKLYRYKANLLLYGVLIGLLANLLYQILNLTISLNVDFTALTFGLILWMFYYSFYKYSLDEASYKIKDLIINKSVAGMIFIDLTDRVYFINEKALNILDLGQTSILNKTLDELDNRFAIHLKENLETRTPSVYQKSSEKIEYFRIASKAITDRKMEIIGQLFVIDDVTEYFEKITVLEVNQTILKGTGENND